MVVNIPKLWMSLFGGFQLKAGEDSEATSLEELDRYMLLAFVACRGGEAKRTDAARTLWPHASTDEPLRRALYELRNALRRSLPPEVPRSDATYVYLPEVRGFIALSPVHCSSDVGQFLAALKRERNASRGERLPCLTEAIEVYETHRSVGPLLEGYAWPWVEKERLALESWYKAAVERREKLAEAGRTLPVQSPHRSQSSSELPSTRHDLGEAVRLAGSSKGGKARVAVLYKRHAPCMEHLLDLLESRLTASGHEVLIDRQMTVGADWSQEMKHQVRDADAVVPLLSAESIWSELMEEEVRIAHEAEQQAGKPRLLPVRVRFTGPLPEPLAAVLDRRQYVVWEGAHDDEGLVSKLLDALQPAPDCSRLEPVGGAMPMDSPFYLARPADARFISGLLAGDGIVLVKGARQMGKTSLLWRGLERARDAGMRTAVTDLQALDAAHFESPERFFMALATGMARQLHLDVSPRKLWDPDLGANDNLIEFVERYVLGDGSGPFVWALDEVDRLFTTGFGSGVFGLFRSWYNLRSLGSGEPWQRLTLAIAHATEPYLFISDLNQSPFNVGTQLVLEDFTSEQVDELNGRYGGPLKSVEDLGGFFSLTGGQPYLTRRGLHEMVIHSWSLRDLTRRAAEDDGPFGDHLRRMLVVLRKDREIEAGVRGLLQGRSDLSMGHFYRLRSGGVVSGPSAASARPRCGLYETYLERHLL